MSQHQEWIHTPDAPFGTCYSSTAQVLPPSGQENYLHCAAAHAIRYKTDLRVVKYLYHSLSFSHVSYTCTSSRTHSNTVHSSHGRGRPVEWQGGHHLQRKTTLQWLASLSEELLWSGFLPHTGASHERSAQKRGERLLRKVTMLVIKARDHKSTYFPWWLSTLAVLYYKFSEMLGLNIQKRIYIIKFAIHFQHRNPSKYKWKTTVTFLRCMVLMKWRILAQYLRKKHKSFKYMHCNWNLLSDKLQYNNLNVYFWCFPLVWNNTC